jgi:hypothetical protein
MAALAEGITGLEMLKEVNMYTLIIIKNKE